MVAITIQLIKFVNLRLRILNKFTTWNRRQIINPLETGAYYETP